MIDFIAVAGLPIESTQFWFKSTRDPDESTHFSISRLSCAG